jgi:hypothetical protein
MAGAHQARLEVHAGAGTTLTAFYDLAVGPVSFDFVVFAVKAELARRKTGAKRLHLVIVPYARGVGGMFRDKSKFYDVHEARWRLWNICIPAAQLLGASVTLATGWGQAGRLAVKPVWPPDWDVQTLKDRRHLIGSLITAAMVGDAIPRLSASVHARRKVREAFARLGKPVVTMTQRSTYLPERNSIPADWLEAAKYIESKGYAVVPIEDTGTALARGGGFAELNLDVRMACYQEAALNLQANNGAASLCWFSEAPYCMFGAGVPADEWDGLFVRQGLPLGETWPWASKGQKICYGVTTRDQIIEEFEKWAGATS